MVMRFPKGQPTEVSDGVFLAAWKAWFERYRPGGASPATDAMPILGEGTTLKEKLAQGDVFNLDVLTRLLVANRMTMQCEPEFRRKNAHLLDEIGVFASNPRGRGHSPGVKLSAQGRQLLRTAIGPEDTVFVDALLAADIEDAAKDVLLDVTTIDPPAEPPKADAASWPPASASMSLREIATGLVDAIEREPFQARYRGKPVGAPVSGWAARRATTFWPSPAVDGAAAQARLRPWHACAAALMAAVAPAAPSARAWTPEEETDAVALAHAVFAWGGVPQPPAKVTAARVRAVFDSVAAGRRVADAPMNGGWTKLAALASHAFGDEAGDADAAGQARALVAWDSRVSHALVRRMDAWFAAAGLTRVPEAVAQVGRVPGRGGTRLGASCRLAWPAGHASWPALLAGGALVRAMRDVLDAGAVATGERDDDGAPRCWTVRDVERVLSMDGY
jgi:hypothetical protein